jgi:hypothetical protein
MSSAHSSFPSRRLALLAFLGGGRPPRHALVCVRSLRGLHRLLLAGGKLPAPLFPCVLGP